MKIKKKKYFIFFSELLPFANLALKNCNQDISQIIIASSFILVQLIEDDELITGCIFI